MTIGSKISLASMALAGGLAAAMPARAADLPLRSAPPSFIAPIPVTNWTGLYGGVSIGFATDRYTFPYAFGSQQTFVQNGRGTIVSHGLIGGGQIGGLYQTPWNFVIGGEINAEGSGTTGHLPVNLGGAFGDIRTNLDFVGAFRLKLGYAFNNVPYIDNLLLYFVLGGAFASFRDRAIVTVGPNILTFNQTSSRIAVSNAVGTVGVGVAHKITPNWSVFGEYRYTALGPPRGYGRQVQISTPFAAGTFGTRAMYHLGRFGLNYHFALW